jgi:hypothetical protein
MYSLTNQRTLLFSVILTFKSYFCEYNNHTLCREKLIVLTGVNHKHLIFLEEEMSFASVETFILYKTWGRSKIALVLAVLGTEEDFEELIDGLQYLK